MDQKEIKHFVEAALLAAGRPLKVAQILDLFDGRSTPEASMVRDAIKELNADYEERGIAIAEVASGFRMQLKASMADRLQKLWEERPPRYSRALFETLALIAYRQPMTRGEIEEIRGVAVSSNIMRSLMEREWVRVVGHRDVPGRPAMFGTTRLFLDYFGLKKLEDLPPLADLSDWESLRVQLDLPAVDEDVSPMPPAPSNDLPALTAEAADEPLDEENVDEDALAEAEALADSGFEELVATAWPEPAAEAAADESDDEQQADIENEADASVGQA